MSEYIAPLLTEQSVIEWEETEDGRKAFLVESDGTRTPVAWTPQPGSQTAFMACPVFEALLEGNRGGGKTDALLMDFAQEVGRGWGAEWKGLLFRESYPQLKDVIEKSMKWFKLIWPEATYNKGEHMWTWPTGETLRFAHMRDPSDYWNYHGHNYTWLGFEELTNWPTPDCFTRMFSVVRSTAKKDGQKIPLRVRATANPAGVGHNWVKWRYRLPIEPNRMIGKEIIPQPDKKGRVGPSRIAIRSRLSENKILISADPDYEMRIAESASDPATLAAWIEGNWDIVAGGMFDDRWNEHVHVLPDFPFAMIPRGWYIDRAYDHGQSHPFSVGWWAESDGNYILYDGQRIGEVRGDMIRIAEWYGWNGTPNEGVKMDSADIAQGILDREDDMGLTGRVHVGPADNQIFSDYEPEESVAGKMSDKGVEWKRTDKSGGSRVQGWQIIRALLKGAIKPANGYRETPGLFITARCEQFRRTIPGLSRKENKPDDIDSRVEDHIADETRYELRSKDMELKSGTY